MSAMSRKYQLDIFANIVYSDILDVVDAALG